MVKYPRQEIGDWSKACILPPVSCLSFTLTCTIEHPRTLDTPTHPLYYIFMDKHTLRKQTKTRRDIMAPEMVIRLSAKITGKFLDELYPQLPVVKCAMAYMPIQSEVKTLRLINTLITRGIRVYVPSVSGDKMTPVLYTKSCKLVKGAFKINEPARKKAIDSHKCIGLVIVPGIAFDLKGHRIGFGKGFYDRFLKKLPSKTVKVGVAFEKQLVADIPHEKHDVHMDYIVTEKRILRIAR